MRRDREGQEIGYRKGEADLLLWLIEKKFGADAVADLRERINVADNNAVRLWSELILTADSDRRPLLVRLQDWPRQSS